VHSLDKMAHTDEGVEVHAMSVGPTLKISLPQNGDRQNGNT